MKRLSTAGRVAPAGRVAVERIRADCRVLIAGAGRRGAPCVAEERVEADSCVVRAASKTEKGAVAFSGVVAWIASVGRWRKLCWN